MRLPVCVTGSRVEQSAIVKMAGGDRLIRHTCTCVSCHSQHPPPPTLSVLLKLLVVRRFSSRPREMASSEKRLQGDWRAVVRQRTSQWLPRKVPVGGVPPRKDSARRVTLLLFFLRQALEGIAR